MNILVTNDDGIASDGLWALVSELKNISRVTVVAPNGERSAIGTAVTLFEPLHVEKINPPVDGIAAYAVDGSPSDCVILGLGKLIEDDVDLVVSGINSNLNLGEDVHISGTVGAALQGYFRGSTALAVSASAGSQYSQDAAAWIVATLAKMLADTTPTRIFLNINVPGLPVNEITGVKITRLARASHINTVEEENHGHRKRYRLVRERLKETGDSDTDIQAIEQGNISLTPLYTSFLDKPPQRLLKKLCTDLLHELKRAFG